MASSLPDALRTPSGSQMLAALCFGRLCIVAWHLCGGQVSWKRIPQLIILVTFVQRLVALLRLLNIYAEIDHESDRMVSAGRARDQRNRFETRCGQAGRHGKS